MIRILIILLLLFTYNYSFGQIDTSGSRDTNRIIIDGVVTTNPINDSSKSVVPNNLLEEIEVFTGGFGAEYGTIYCRFPYAPKKDSIFTKKDSVKEDSMDEKGVNIRIKGNRSDENKIIIDGVISNDNFEAEYGNASLRGPMYYSWYISHSIGFAPEESEPVFYVSVSKKITNVLHLGLKGGVYTFEADLDRAVNDTIQSYAPYPSQGTFVLIADYVTQGPTYVGALYALYDLSKNISITGSGGIRIYSEDRWNGQIAFSISSNNNTPPEVTIFPFMNFRKISTESILKPYFSLGANYRTGKFEIGFFADNILSFGVNLGMGFN